MIPRCPECGKAVLNTDSPANCECPVCVKRFRDYHNRCRYAAPVRSRPRRREPYRPVFLESDYNRVILSVGLCAGGNRASSAFEGAIRRSEDSSVSSSWA